jgi:hypothetical protein
MIDEQRIINEFSRFKEEVRNIIKSPKKLRQAKPKPKSTDLDVNSQHNLHFTSEYKNKPKHEI